MSNESVSILNMFPDYEPPEVLRESLSQAAIVAADIDPLLGYLQQWRLWVRSPTWITIAVSNLVTSQCQSALYHLFDIVLLALDR